jgi:hypothetical protein
MRMQTQSTRSTYLLYARSRMINMDRPLLVHCRMAIASYFRIILPALYSAEAFPRLLP